MGRCVDSDSTAKGGAEETQTTAGRAAPDVSARGKARRLYSPGRLPSLGDFVIEVVGVDVLVLALRPGEMLDGFDDDLGGVAVVAVTILPLVGLVATENGGEKLGHGSGGMELLRAA